MNAQTETERRILDAAKRIFVRKGLSGTSMQDIANETGISRTALHYHFRSKQRLFDAVLTDLFARFLPQVEDIFAAPERGVREKLERFAAVYLDLLSGNPYLPNFIMNEINKNPEDCLRRLQAAGVLSPRLQDRVRRDLKAVAPHLDAPQFMMNLISLCVFPFIARPVVEAFFGDGRREAFQRFIEERKDIIVDTMLASIEHSSGEGSGLRAISR